MGQAKVSAVIATYNRARYIEESLSSILRQTVPAHEIIVVDDGSDDDTADRVARFGGRIRYVRKDNGGRASALNLALPLVTGEWVWCFDDDDVALPDSIETRLRAAAARPDADVVASGQLVGVESPTGELETVARVELTLPADDALLLNVLKAYAFRLQGMLIRKRCFDVVGGFDESYLRSQDYEMIVRLLRRFKVAIAREPTFVWRNHLGVRGPAHQRHGGRDRAKAWMQYDGMLGRQVRATFELGEFLVPPVAEDVVVPPERRLALLNRMAVMASKGLLDETLADAGMAASISWPGGDGERLSRAERRVCVQAAMHPYFIDRALESRPSLVEGLRRLADSGVKRAIAGCLARGLLYAATHRELDAARRFELARLALRVAAVGGLRSFFTAYAVR